MKQLATILILCAALTLPAQAFLFPTNRPSVDLTLAWDKCTNADVVAYSLYWGVASRSYTNTLKLGDVSTGTISNLALGTTYFFAATATDRWGFESEFSNEVTYTIKPPPAPPLLHSVLTLTVQTTPDLALPWWEDVFELALSEDWVKRFYRLRIGPWQPQ
jgi:hypothetical protein